MYTWLDKRQTVECVLRGAKVNNKGRSGSFMLIGNNLF